MGTAEIRGQKSEMGWGYRIILVKQVTLKYVFQLRKYISKLKKYELHAMYLIMYFKYLYFNYMTTLQTRRAT